ncbi:MAG: Tim44/TimA family putative adaptor protein [Pseudomonadota bacterium]
MVLARLSATTYVRDEITGRARFLIEVLIAAAVALFVLSRLYVALGRDDGPPEGRSRSPAGASAPSTLSGGPREVEEPTRQRPIFHGPAATGLETIYEADETFHPDEFRTGARAAYEMILSAYASGDRKALRPLLDDDVFEAWDSAITEREASGDDPFELLRVQKLEIEDAELDGSTARVMVRFEAELGDGESTRRARDIWTFKRDITNNDPNWVLDDVETAT